MRPGRWCMSWWLPRMTAPLGPGQHGIAGLRAHLLPAAVCGLLARHGVCVSTLGTEIRALPKAHTCTRKPLNRENLISVWFTFSVRVRVCVYQYFPIK